MKGCFMVHSSGESCDTFCFDDTHEAKAKHKSKAKHDAEAEESHEASARRDAFEHATARVVATGHAATVYRYVAIPAETPEDTTEVLEQTGMEAPQSLPGNIVVRGEVFIAKKEFKRLNKVQERTGGQTYANPRNVAAGSVG